jgi:hypothetical protein
MNNCTESLVAGASQQNAKEEPHASTCNSRMVEGLWRLQKKGPQAEVIFLFRREARRTVAIDILQRTLALSAALAHIRMCDAFSGIDGGPGTMHSP